MRILSRCRFEPSRYWLRPDLPLSLYLSASQTARLVRLDPLSPSDLSPPLGLSSPSVRPVRLNPLPLLRRLDLSGRLTQSGLSAPSPRLSQLDLADRLIPFDQPNPEAPSHRSIPSAPGDQCRQRRPSAPLTRWPLAGLSDLSDLWDQYCLVVLLHLEGRSPRQPRLPRESLEGLADRSRRYLPLVRLALLLLSSPANLAALLDPSARVPRDHPVGPLTRSDLLDLYLPAVLRVLLGLPHLAVLFRPEIQRPHLNHAPSTIRHFERYSHGQSHLKLSPMNRKGHLRGLHRKLAEPEETRRGRH
jgi:hypothetical protein